MGNGDRGTGITHTDHRRSERPPSSLSSKPSDEWKKKKGDKPTGTTHIKHAAESITDTARVHIHHFHTQKSTSEEKW